MHGAVSKGDSITKSASRMIPLQASYSQSVQAAVPNYHGLSGL